MQPSGRVMRTPVAPPMYDYELEPQAVCLLIPTDEGMADPVKYFFAVSYRVFWHNNEDYKGNADGAWDAHVRRSGIRS